MSEAATANGSGRNVPEAWFGRIPSHWNVRRARILFRERTELSSEGTEELLSVSHLTGVTARAEKDVSMFLAETLEGYKIVRPDDLVVNTMWAWMGAMGMSPLSGCASPSYAVYRQRVDHFVPDYLDFLVRSAPFVAEVNRRSKGIWASRLRLYPDAFLDMRFPVPPLATQRAIADFLRVQTNRIDQLVEKKERLADLIGARWEALIHKARSEPGAKWLRFRNIASRVQRAIPSEGEHTYTPLGLLNRGRGFFKKVEADEDNLGDSDFFWVREGDVVFSGQFAWEGAIGLVTSAEDGCVVSHRYPVYRANEGVEAEYLYAFFRTAHGAFLMDNCSRGAAGRNRPLNTWSLEREAILIPSRETQRKVSHLVELEGKIRRFVREYVRRATELRSSLVTAAVTGQIEVPEKAAPVIAKPDRNCFLVMVGAEIVQRHQGNPKFGRVKLQKELYLAEMHAGITELHGTYFREAAGPLDRTLVEDTERGMDASAFFRAALPDIHTKTSGVTYTPLPKAGQHRAELESQLGPRVIALRKLIEQLSDFDTRAVEAIATLYAVWNDALIDGETCNDDIIIRAVLNDWHPEKKEKFRDVDLRHWLDWMKRNAFVPSGRGSRTISTASRDMFA